MICSQINPNHRFKWGKKISNLEVQLKKLKLHSYLETAKKNTIRLDQYLGGKIPRSKIQYHVWGKQMELFTLLQHYQLKYFIHYLIIPTELTQWLCPVMEYINTLGLFFLK